MSDMRYLYGIAPSKAQAKQDFIKRAAEYFHTAGTTGFLEDQTPEEKRQIVRELLKKAGAKVKPE